MELCLIIDPAKRINASVTTAYVTNTVSRLHVQIVTEFCCCCYCHITALQPRSSSSRIQSQIARAVGLLYLLRKLW